MLPIIGSIHHLIGSELLHRRVRALALRHGPDLMLMRLGQVDTVIISSQAAALDVFRTHDLNFSSRPQLVALDKQTYSYAGIIFSPHGSHWRQMRRICVTELLSPKRVRSFRSVREEEILSLVEEISAGSGRPLDLGRKLRSLSNAIVFRAMVGERCRHQEEFFSITKEALKLIMGTTFSDMFPSLKFLDVLNGTKSRLARLHKSVNETLDEIVEEHEKALPSKNGKEDDLLDVLLRLKDSDELDIPLTRENIKPILADLFGAGTDTASTTIEWAMAELMRNPETMRKAQGEIRRAAAGGRTKLEEEDVADLNYLKLVIKETLRLHPPVPLIPRECTESCQVRGYTIPRGTKILVNLLALGTDPKHWEEPDEFRPERFDGSPIDFKGFDFCYLPFGGGRRICPGIAFGMATVELTLAHLLDRFDWELAGGKKADTELDMSEAFSATLSRKSELNLVATVRAPSTDVE